MTGLLIDGKLHAVPGVRVLAPLEEPWAKLTRGQARSAKPQYKILHKTIADDREQLLDAPGPSDGWGGARDTIEDWHRRGLSGAQEVTGHDGSTVCTADLWRFESWHAGARDADANPRSWGHELKEHLGGVNRAALEAAVAVTLFDTAVLGVQWQCPRRYVNNKQLQRFAYSNGANLVGVFGHRDVTRERGYWDPGDIVFEMLEHEGFERLDFEAREDLEVWARRQEWLSLEGHYHGGIDGIAGPQTTAALASLGYPSGILALGRRGAEALPQPPGGW